MNVKGTAVKSIPEFVDRNFPTRKQEWLSALPENSRKIMNGLIFTNNWYPIVESLTIPMKTISSVFYNGDDIKTARTMGKFSADIALHGVYKFFIQFGSPKFIIERGGRIFQTYFEPSEIVVLNAQKNSLTMQITKFPESDIIIDHNVAGWIERALEISGCKNVKAEILKSISTGNSFTDIAITWG